MQALVIYDSKFGNTERIAQAIGKGIAASFDVRVLSTTAATAVAGSVLPRPDLLILGGPTQNHGPSPLLKGFANDLPAALRGVPAVAFDTRYRGPALLMGSAAAAVAKAVTSAGTPLAAPPASFFIRRSGSLPRQLLEAGELERAEAWGRTLATAIASTATGHLVTSR